MTGDEAVVAVIDALESAGIAYMLVGSLADQIRREVSPETTGGEGIS